MLRSERQTAYGSFRKLECDLGVPIKIKGYIVYWGPPYLSKLPFVSEVSEHSWDGLLCGSGFPIALAYWLLVGYIVERAI